MGTCTAYRCTPHTQPSTPLKPKPKPVFWAARVQIRPHLCDVWALGLTGIAVVMAVHQACYNALGPRLELFNVRTRMCVCACVYIYIDRTGGMPTLPLITTTLI